MANVRCNLIRNVLGGVSQKGAQHDAQAAERDAGILDVPQTLCISPPAPQQRRLNDGRRQAWDLARCQLRRHRQEQCHKFRHQSQWQTCFSSKKPG